jgi:hypothetical protein
MIMEVEVDGDDYPYVSRFTKHFFDKFRISIGDV